MYESGAQNPNTLKSIDKAKTMYEQIRRRKTDIFNISKNTGLSIEQCTFIKNYAFLDKHELTEGYVRFTSDFAMASSWFRLSEKSGKNIKQHDRIMLMHELYEINLLLNNPELTQRDAHFMAEKKYNYSLACKKYYNLI